MLVVARENCKVLHYSFQSVTKVDYFVSKLTRYPTNSASVLKQTLWLSGIILFSLYLTGCDRLFVNTNSLSQVLSSGVLRVGTTYGSTTYFLGSNGSEGFEYELAKGFADYLDVELEIYPYYNFNQIFPQLAQGHLDIVAAGITATEKRQSAFKFGPAYQTVSQKLVYKQGRTRPKSPYDLQGKLTVTVGSSHAETLQILQQNEPNWQQVNWHETANEDVEELLLLIQQDKLDYTIIDSNTLAVMRRLYPELSVGFTVYQQQQVAWALNQHQDDALLGALIEYFGEIKNNGTLAVLEEKYFGHVRQFNYVDTSAFLAAAKNTLPQYQAFFEHYAADVDWRLIAAMSYQESHWDPLARSPTGVRGIMMLTLPTAKDWGVTSRLDVEQSIRGGTQYFSNLLRRIPDRIQYPDRMWFALAAYNIGLGHLEDARILTQRAGGNPDLWIDVKRYLPQLRQKRFYKTTKYGYARGNEAVKYVSNIRRYYDSLVFLTEQNTAQDITISTEK